MKLNYTCAIAAGTLLLARELTKREKDKERKEKKEKVADLKHKLLQETFPELTVGFALSDDICQFLLDGVGKWTKSESTNFIIDLAFTNPFAPYELKFNDSDFENALKAAAFFLSFFNPEDVDRIRQTQKEALKAHHHINLKKIAIYGIGGIILAGTGGYLFAPLIGSALGAGAGLSGAAATSHGLALLGGGSLSIGGAGMAGGTWLVTGAGAFAGLFGIGGGNMLLQLGAANTKVELIKLQVSYKEMVLGGQMQVKKAQEVIKSLVQQRDEIKQRLEEERELNEKNSARLENMEETLTALEDGLRWMKEAA